MDSDCKKWRLVADVLNDISFFVDLTGPYFKAIIIPLMCISSLFRSLVGVAGGATRTALTQHQARRNNLADVAAKDGSQETLVNLSALICSFILVPLVTGNQPMIWTLFFLLTALHLFANFRAVRCLNIDVLNRQRLRNCSEAFCQTGEILGIKTGNRRESVFFSFNRETVQINYGCSLNDLNKIVADWSKLAKEFEGKRYLIAYNDHEIAIALRSTATNMDQLESALIAEFCRLAIIRREKFDFQAEIQKALGLLHRLQQKGWNISYSLLNFEEWRIIS